MEKIVVANLKMNLNENEIIDYEKELNNNNFNNIKLFIAPSYIYLNHFKNGKYILTSQDVSKHLNGPYTGEVSAYQLKSLGVKSVIINHSEINNDIKSIKQKINNAIKNNLIVILCIDESEDLIKNINNYIEKYDPNKIIIAYEPHTKIGGNKSIDFDKIKSVYTKIKSNFKNKVIYGGSVNIENIEEICSITDGVIIGNKSIDVKYLCKMIEKIM